MVKLESPPEFKTILSQVGDAVAEDTGLTLVEFPVTRQIDTRRADTVVLYWRSDSAGATDSITFEVLFFDGVRERYVRGPKVEALLANTLGVLAIEGASNIVIRIDAVSFGDIADQNVVVKAARFSRLAL